MQPIRTYLLWVFYALSSLLLCIWLVWHLLAQVNFVYPLWYSLLNIDQTIEQTSPRHLHKKQFDQTTRQEHQRLFAEIVHAVQNKGKGLAQIKYRDRDGNILDTLLTSKEIIHLQDVANFVSSLNWLSIVLLVVSLVLLALMFLLRIPMLALANIVAAMVAMIVVGVLVLLVAGPTKVFYWLHPIVFPADHQWFFYYEESLMSTLMKAPVLFAPLGAQLMVLGLVIWGLHLLLLKKLRVFKSV